MEAKLLSEERLAAIRNGCHGGEPMIAEEVETPTPGIYPDVPFGGFVAFLIVIDRLMRPR